MSTVALLVPMRLSSFPVLNQTVSSPRFTAAESSAPRCVVSHSVSDSPRIPELNTPMAENRSRVGEGDGERLTSTHRQPRDRAMTTTGRRSVMTLDVRHQIGLEL